VLTASALALAGGKKVEFDIWGVLRTLNENNGLVTAVATVVLVLITAFYTIATFKLVAVTLKLRSDQIRPVFNLSARITDFEKEAGSTRARFEFEIELVNFGPSPAIGVRVSPNIPMLDEKGVIYNYVTTDPAPRPPGILHQNIVFVCKFRLYADKYDAKAFATDFLELELLYQDIDMNLYHQQESYWLHAVGIEGDENYKLYLSKDYEALHMMRAHDRTAIADTRSIWWTNYKTSVIFERTRH
jgi:hypothetical protein